MDLNIRLRTNVDSPPSAWNEGATFVGAYAGIRYYSRNGKIICLFGWVPQEFGSILAFKRAVNKREKELE